MDINKIVALQRKYINKHLLPDRCKIFPKVGANPVIVGGVLTSSPPVAKTYNGDSDIPCRIDLSRAFRPDRLKVQVTEVDEYNLELPYDVDVQPSDLIHLTDPRTSEVTIFEVRKRKNQSNWDGTVECVIAAPGTELDAHS